MLAEFGDRCRKAVLGVWADAAPTGWRRVLRGSRLVLPALLAADLRHLSRGEEASLCLGHRGDEVAGTARLEHLVTVRLLVLCREQSEMGDSEGSSISGINAINDTIRSSDIISDDIINGTDIYMESDTFVCGVCVCVCERERARKGCCNSSPCVLSPSLSHTHARTRACAL